MICLVCPSFHRPCRWLLLPPLTVRAKMSEANDLAYDGFDGLPRWQTHDPLSSSGQAAHSAYYAGGPPPPPPQRLASSQTQPRYLMDDQTPLSRSSSLNSRGPRRQQRGEEGYPEYEYNDYYSQYSYGHHRSNSKQAVTSPTAHTTHPVSPYSPHPPSFAYPMDTTSPPPPMKSSPSTPFYGDHPMASLDIAKRRPTGFRTVRSNHDLQPRTDLQPQGRRMGADGTYLSPLRQLTTSILDTYRICNPQFRYESTHNPRRVLTKPSKPAHNEGFDNDDYDYILYVNDWLGTEDGHK